MQEQVNDIVSKRLTEANSSSTGGGDAHNNLQP